MIADPSIFVQHDVLAIISASSVIASAFITKRKLNGHEKRYHRKEEP